MPAMGWCHEFGPQIVESCEHPMTAGPSSCSCERCGTVCTGRFGGCADVWDRAPLRVVPGRAASVREGATSDVTEPAPAPEHQPAPSPGVPEGPEPAGLNGTEMSAVLAHLFQRVEALESAPARPEGTDAADPGTSAVLAHLLERVEALESAPAPGAPSDHAGPGATTGPAPDVLPDVLRRLEHLTAGLGGLDELSRRLAALEQADVRTPSEPTEPGRLAELVEQMADHLDRHRARTMERLDEHGVALDALTDLPERVSALEWVGDDTTAVKEALTELGRGLDRLSTESEQLVALPQRVAALEQSLDRTTVLEQAVAELEPALVRVAQQVQALATVPERVEALEQAAVTAPDAFDRQLAGMEKSVADLGGTIDQLAERVAGLGGRIDALERAAFGGGPVPARSRSIVADVDALQSQVEDVADAVDGVPRRLATVEGFMARTGALERGLAGAIDLIDQLVAQVAALEWAYRPLPAPDEDS